MELIDRYVVEVARHLPAKTAEDVAEELHSLLTDALEARAARTGRPKDEALAVEVLREFGEPDDVAARYSEPKHLIGPQWYPVFESVALAVLLIPLAIKLIVGQIHILLTGDLPSWQSVLSETGGYIQGAFVSFALVVVVFAILERTIEGASSGVNTDWDPRELPPLPEQEGNESGVSRWESAVNVWGAVFWLSVLNTLPSLIGMFWRYEYRWWFLSAPELGIPLPVPLLNTYLGGVLVLNVVLWRQGRWSAATRWAQFAVGLFAAVVIAVTLSTAGAPTIDAEWLRARGWDAEYAGALAAAEKVSRILRGLLWTALFWQIWNSARRLWRLLEGRRITSSPAHPLTF